jgi:acetoin utilization deacetylase AcuC-like enzyme
VSSPVLLTHPSSLHHDAGAGHPERAERMRSVLAALDARGWLGWAREESPAATDAQLTAVHPAPYVARLRGFTGRIDADTVMGPGSFAAAEHAAGGAARAVDLVLGGGAPFAASLHRPPGHHAEAARAMGFCLLNAVAVAAQHALDAHGLSRVLVLDWDVHHGNGTNDVFHATDRVLFASVHESPLYPGTGAASDIGSGRGAGHTVNLPVPGGSGDDVWCSMVEHCVVPLARAYAPELVLVSAGFDAHAEDPLASCRVSDAGFATMAGSVARLGADLGVPVALVLEGGYATGALARSLLASLEVLGAADGPPPAPELPVHALAGQAARRLTAHWPVLAGR